MSGPSQYVRQMREQGARRRLEIAKVLRDAPSTTNKQLASALNVNRNTITQDRKIMVEDLKQQTLTKTELMRDELFNEFLLLKEEVKKHRGTDGKLSLGAIDRLESITRSIMELTGARKPVTEKVEIRKRTISFSTSIVSDGVVSTPKTFEVTHDALALTEGNNERH